MRTSVYREPSTRETAPPAGMHPRDAGPQPWMQPPVEAAFGWRTYGGAAPGRIYLVAVEHETFPPMAFAGSILQRMRVVPVPADFPFDPIDASPVAPRSLSAPARAVTGEILRDERGNYYEKIGHTVRELGKLEASPGGDLVEVEQPAAWKEEAQPFRKLFADPGERRVLRWGEFRGLLAGQIAHPERLRDEHRLPCYVQVVEAGAREPVAELAKSAFGDAAAARQLVGLSRDAAIRLELQDVLPPARQRPPEPRVPGIVLPGDRLFRLSVADDPTAEVAPATPPKKREVPEPFASQTFPRGRDEALLEMRMTPGALDRVSQWTRSLFSRAVMDRWLRSLWGKQPDDQLWAIAPPPGMLADTAVREWAAATLEMAGYDAPAMLREWEIYWRRKRA